MTAPQLASLSDVQRYARGALAAADATNVIPVPIDDVIAAAQLRPAQALYELGDNPPKHIRDVLAKIKNNVLGAFDLRERQIFIDSTMGLNRQRFVKGHEAGHALMPWHEGAFMADDKTTLAPETHLGLEQEANAFAAELIFGADAFIRRADDSAPGLGRPLELAPEFQASQAAALRRYAEYTRHQVALLVFGRYTVTVNGVTGLKLFAEQCVQSASFADRYGSITDLVPRQMSAQHGPAIAAAIQAGQHASYEPTSLVLADLRRGGTVEFTAEVLYNGYLHYVLLYRRSLFSGPRVRIVPS